MKKVMKSIFAAALILCLSCPGFAAQVEKKAECQNNECEGFRIGMYRINGTVTMNFLMEKEKKERVRLRLMDTQGKILHEEYFGKGLSKLSRKFNFSQVADGHYQLEVSDQNQRIVKNIYLTSKDVSEVERRMVTMN